jgi:DNA-binding NarL/FixJ family response regulator
MTGGTLMVSRAVKLHGHFKKELEVLGFKDVSVTSAAKDGLNMAINELKPRLLIIGCGFYKCSTPYMMSLLLRQYKGLNIAAVSLSEYPADLAMWFILNGVKSCIHLYDGIDQFYQGIGRIRDGKSFVSDSVKESIEMRRELPDPARKLTRLQLEIVKLVCNGLSACEVGDVLSISERTVYNEKTKIYTYLNVRNENELIRTAIELGIVNPDELIFYADGYVSKPLPEKK